MFLSIDIASVINFYDYYFDCVLFSTEKMKKGEKRQIEIPMDKGRNMLGVLDETGQLEYGQVYVQYTTCMETGQLLQLTGEMYTFAHCYKVTRISATITVLCIKRKRTLLSCSLPNAML